MPKKQQPQQQRAKCNVYVSNFSVIQKEAMAPPFIGLISNFLLFILQYLQCLQALTHAQVSI